MTDSNIAGDKPGSVVVREAGTGFAQEILAGNHELVSDEPRDVGGTDTGPTPYDHLLAALGACTSMTVRMYAKRKGWPLERVTVRLRHSRIHASDCEHCETEVGRLDRIERELTLEGPLSQEQRERLLQISEMCPVHRTLTSETVIDTTLR